MNKSHATPRACPGASSFLHQFLHQFFAPSARHEVREPRHRQQHREQDRTRLGVTHVEAVFLGHVVAGRRTERMGDDDARPVAGHTRHAREERDAGHDREQPEQHHRRCVVAESKSRLVDAVTRDPLAEHRVRQRALDEALAGGADHFAQIKFVLRQQVADHRAQRAARKDREPVQALRATSELTLQVERTRREFPRDKRDDQCREYHDRTDRVAKPERARGPGGQRRAADRCERERDPVEPRVRFAPRDLDHHRHNEHPEQHRRGAAVAKPERLRDQVTGGLAQRGRTDDERPVETVHLGKGLVVLRWSSRVSSRGPPVRSFHHERLFIARSAEDAACGPDWRPASPAHRASR